MKSINIDYELHKAIKTRSTLMELNIGETAEELLKYALENYQIPEKLDESKIMTPPFPKGSLLDKLHKLYVGDDTPTRSRNKRNPNAEWIPPKKARKQYNSSFQLNENKEVELLRKYQNGSVHPVTYSKDLFEIMYVHHIVNQGVFRVGDKKNLEKKFKVQDVPSFERFVENVRMGTFDDGVINPVRDAINSAIVYNTGNAVFINGEKSSVTIGLAKEIHDLMSNCREPMDCIWGLTHTYQWKGSSYEIMIIAMHYTQLVFTDKNDFVENNPSKRRNLMSVYNGNLGRGGEFNLLSLGAI